MAAPRVGQGCRCPPTTGVREPASGTVDKVSRFGTVAPAVVGCAAPIVVGVSSAASAWETGRTRACR